MLRMTSGRKAELINAIRAGSLSRELAIKDKGLSEEELVRWEELFDRYGLNGLKTTRVQQYRKHQKRPSRSKELNKIIDAFKDVIRHPSITIRCKGDTAVKTWNVLALLLEPYLGDVSQQRR